MSEMKFDNWLDSIDHQYIKIKSKGTETYLFGSYVQILLGFDHKESNKYYFAEKEIDVLTFASIKKTFKLPYTFENTEEGNVYVLYDKEF